MNQAMTTVFVSSILLALACARHAERAGGLAGDGTGARDDPVPARDGVDGDVDEKRSSPADDVRADAARRQFGEIWQIEFADDHLGGGTRCGTRPRTDSGGGGEESAHRMVALARTSSPSASGR